MLAPSSFEFLFAATTLLAIAVLLRRLRALDADAATRGRASRTPGAEATEPASTPPGASSTEPDREVPLADLLASPISVIVAECELARGTGRMDARLERVERHARRAAELLRRPEAARLPEPTTPDPARAVGSTNSPEARLLEPAEFVQAALDNHAEMARARGVSVHLVAEPAPAVRANPFLLSHALRHLVRAAIEAAPRITGDVTVAVGELDGEALFAVADNGPGLGAERLAAIFDPVARSDAQGCPEALAYAIVHAVSRALGARFLLDTAPGAGTRATIRMPAAVASPPAPAAPGRPNAASAASEASGAAGAPTASAACRSRTASS